MEEMQDQIENSYRSSSYVFPGISYLFYSHNYFIYLLSL